MGQKGRAESVTRVLAALYRRKTWQQKELAREVGIGTEALRKVLRDIEAIVHLEQDAEHPHVYWSAPKTWFPGGVLFEQKHVPELLQQLRRLPRSKARERLLDVIAEQLPRGREQPAAPVVTRATTEQEEQHATVIEESAARKVTLRMKYLTGGRGPLAERHASVHLVDAGPPLRFIATCHRNGALRTFRADNVMSARVDEKEPFRDCDAAKVAAYRAAGLDGYTGSGPPSVHSFFVRDPEAGWVGNNLLEGMRVESVHGGIRVTVETSSLERLARFVVGLGAAACPETRALAEGVADLARGALERARRVIDTKAGDAAEGMEAPAAASDDAPVRPSSDV